MCCFSQPVRFVGATKIFARGLPEGRQLLAYAMDIEIDQELAMVLPIPVPPATPDDAVEFISLEGYESFFLDVARAFPTVYAGAPQAKGGISRGALAAPKLVVHDVGLFEASFVPTRADFARLDARFRLPEGVWDQLDAVRDYGFAVFRLKPKKRALFGFSLRDPRQSVHPMAFSFPRRDPSALFFPTLHIHDGHVSETAHFDHMLYCQADPLLESLLAWTRSTKALDQSVDVTRARGVVAPAQHALQLAVWGQQPNTDWHLRPPSGIRAADVQGRGPCHRYQLRVASAFESVPVDARRRAWRKSAQERAAALAAALREGLPALCEREHGTWGLGAFDPALPPHFLNGRQLWSGTSFMDGRPATAGGPGRVSMQVFTEHVEPQTIELAFARLPDQEGVDRIFDALAGLLDRAVA